MVRGLLIAASRGTEKVSNRFTLGFYKAAQSATISTLFATSGDPTTDGHTELFLKF